MSDHEPAAIKTASKDGGHFYHHGRSPAAWLGSVTSIVAAVIAFFAVVPNLNATIGIIAAAVWVVGMIGVLVLRAIGYGQGGRRP